MLCGTVSSAVAPVLPFCSDTKGKSEFSDGNDSRAARAGVTSGL